MKTVIWILGIVAVIALGWYSFMYVLENGDLSDRAELLCSNSNVASVEISRSTQMIKVIHSFLGGGVTYYTQNETSFSCPVVGPDAVSQECKDVAPITDWEVVCDLTQQGGDNPLNTAYQIEGEWVLLADGHTEHQAAPGSATTIVTEVVGEPVYGDLNGDGQDDAVLFLSHDPGGSGTFYYLAAAYQKDGAYYGTNTILLGDRISPETVAISTRVIEATYQDRAVDDPMSVPPSIEKTRYGWLEDETLKNIALSENEMLLSGYVFVDEGDVSFSRCDAQQDYWVDGDMVNTLVRAYQNVAREDLLVPLYAVMVGGVREESGQGAYGTHDQVFEPRQVLFTWQEGSCKSDMIVVTSLVPGDSISSPLTIEGRARGPWYFEADFPVSVVDWDGRIIGGGIARAQDEWMTIDFVPFRVDITFELPPEEDRVYDRGAIIFEKDNPSGLPENADALEIPILFQ
jgi:hypothetical protein